MRMLLCFLLLCLLTPALLSPAQVEVLHVNAIKADAKTGEGVFFALPRTVVGVDVTVELKKFSPGKFARYAIFFFPETYHRKGNPTKEARSFNVKEVAFTSRGEPDTDWVFWAKLKSGVFLDRSLSLQMTEAGAVTGATATVDNTLPDFLTSVLGTATGMATKAYFAGKADCVKVDSVDKYVRCVLMKGDPQRIADYEEALRAPDGSAANAAVLGEITATAAGFDISADLRRAFQAFERYYELDNRRANVLINPGAGIGVTDYVTQLDAAREAVKKQFTGASESTPWSGRFDIRPAKGGAARWDLMALDAQNGACWNEALFQGKAAIPKEYLRGGAAACPAGTQYTLQVSATATSRDLTRALQGKAKPYDQKVAGQGLPYRVPAELTFRALSEGKATTYFSNILVGQLGMVLALPSKLGGRQTKTGLAYFETTGAIKSLDSTAKTLFSKSLADAAGSSASGVLDAKLAAEKAAAAKVDPLAILQRQRQLLEEESKIVALCASLGRTNCVPATQ